MDCLQDLRTPIEKELQDFTVLFRESLSHGDGMLNDALSHICNRGGKMMRPMLVMLIAKMFGEVNSVTLNGALGLELLHTASLVHDDVVDDSDERRGQASVNALFDNKVSILVGDYILSTALYYVAQTHHLDIVSHLAHLGRVLSEGEVKQLENIGSDDISEEAYYVVIHHKTASLFAACARIGAMSVNATESDVVAAESFGETLGMIFQIRDDIFDYFPSNEVGKPTGNDMLEGKLTLPVIHALLQTGDEDMMRLARAVKAHTITADETKRLVEFTLRSGGIEYAEKKMDMLKRSALDFIARCADAQVRHALEIYLDYVITRNK